MKELIKEIEQGCKGQIRFQQKRPDLYQVYLPVFYEDGDMIDVFISPDDKNNGFVRIKDCGTTLMKLSCSYDINTPTKETIFNKTINQKGIQEKNGELFLECKIDHIFNGLMQFTGCQQKISNMRGANEDEQDTIPRM